MRAWRHDAGIVLRGQHRADREAAAQRFSGRQDIGRNAIMHICIQFAGTSDARLHLIKNQ
ncbi:Uncharacterised protein [Salmonella enterica subsp. enterica serovar Typhimurium str. DT104]|nr:Uncharacterised protein [Salmonella enterica subsp. enterica serovar Typhimurium str. DT104]